MLPVLVFSAAGLFFGLSLYPLNPLWLGALLVLYATILSFRPKFWLFLLPAILPAANLSPWSGSLFIEELDYFVLATLVVEYVRLARTPVTTRFSAAVAWLLAVLAISYAVSAWIGLMPIPEWSVNALSNYMGRFNSLRILKPFLWALLLLPILRRTLDRDALLKLLVPGMLAGLTFVCASGIWERMTFPGLMDFSSDYRITAPFPEMHVGGAALDAYLALTMPFALGVLLYGQTFLSRAMAGVITAAGAYITLVTFSRGLYAGLALSAVLLIFSQARIFAAKKTLRLPGFVAILLLMGGTLIWTFDVAGYRGLAAETLIFAAAVFLGGREAGAGTSSILPAILLSAVVVGLSTLFPKGAYMGYALSAATFAAVSILGITRAGNVEKWLAWPAFIGMGVAHILLCLHWGGARAEMAAIAGVIAALFIVISNRSMAAPIWRFSAQSGSLFGASLLLMALATPVLANSYMSHRMASTEKDLGTRETHWENVAGMVSDDWASRIWGMGLGRLPDLYFWKNKSGETPGSYQLGREHEEGFLRLSGSRFDGGGESLHYGQRISVNPNQTYSLEFMARTHFEGELAQVSLCAKYLIYFYGACQVFSQAIVPDGQWHEYRAAMPSGNLGAGAWYARPTIQLSLSSERGAGYFDITRVRLSGADGNNLISNDDFSHGWARWFFTSDHYHLPWHAKSLLLNLYFDQGFFGVFAFMMLFGAGVIRAFTMAVRGQYEGSVFLASFAGFAIVGLFDSILDFPRLALLFYLLLFSSLLVPVRAIFASQKN